MTRILRKRLVGFYFQLPAKSGASRKDVWLMCCGVLFSVAAGLPFPLLGIIFGNLVDEINSSGCSSDPTSALQSVATHAFYMIGVAVFNFLALYIQAICWSLSGERLVRRLRERYLESLLRQEMAYFDSITAAEVSVRLTDNLETIQAGTSEKVGIFLTSISYFCIAYIVAFTKYPKLSGILVSLVPAYLIVCLFCGYFNKKYSKAISHSVEAATSIASDSLMNFRVVEAFGAKRVLRNIFSDHIQDCVPFGLKKAAFSALQFGSVAFISICANSIAFWQGSRDIAASKSSEGSGAPSAGSVYTVIFLLLDVSFIISQISPYLSIFSSASSAAERIFEVIDRTPEIDSTPPSTHNALDLRDSVKFKNVSFTYQNRPGVRVLESVNLEIPANKHTAIIGLSGSGKSTIAGLLSRLYKPCEGSIEFDGLSLESTDIHSLRAHMAVVEQDSSLFQGSILENIAIGLVNSPQYRQFQNFLTPDFLTLVANELQKGEALSTAFSLQGPNAVEVATLVHNAAKLANAAGFIERLEDGYGTDVGDRGSRLSGGQIQRVALARALVRNPQLLILDEATSSLDSRAEARIRDNIETVFQGRTVVSIAHRLSTIQNADKVIVLRNGRVVQEGDPTSLADQPGIYQDMINHQRISTNQNSGNSKATSINEASTKLPDRTSLQHPDTHDTGHIDKELGKSIIVPGALTELAQQVQHQEPDPKSAVSARKLFKGLYPFVRPYLLLFTLGILGAAVVGGSYTGEAFIFGNVVSSLSNCTPIERVLILGQFFSQLFFILACVELLANFVCNMSLGWLAVKLLARLRALLFQALLEKTLAWHEAPGNTAANSVSLMIGDTNALHGLAGTTVGVFFAVAIGLMAGIVASHIVAWRIAVVLIATVPLLLGSGFMRFRVLGKMQEEQRTAFAQSAALAMETVQAIKTVQLYTLEHYAIKRYRNSLQGPAQSLRRTILWSSLWLSLGFSISIPIYALAYWWGAKQVSDGEYTQTQFFIVLPALLISAQSCGQLFALAPDVAKARVAATNILSEIETVSPQSRLPGRKNSSEEDRSDRSDLEMSIESKGKVSPSPETTSVSMLGVCFAYPSNPTKTVLNGLSLEIEAGKFCALIGPSGSGKSTVISLIERFYSPQSGVVLVNGRDINTGDTSYRDQVALVPQEAALFDNTVRFNVELGAVNKASVTQEEVETACQLANIHDTIKAMPEGYDTRCGPGGNNFSAGQKQRLAVARALLRHPRLLLLDETTSALDTESELLLQQSLERIAATRGITILAIAHRLCTIQRADTIFMLDKGRVADQGTHHELLERSELYRADVLHQAI